MKKGRETKSNNRCNASSQHQLESHQGDDLINCKKREHIVLKQIIDPKANMVFARNKWNKIAKDLQETTKSKSPYNGRMCNDKQTCVNNNYKKISNYHKGTGHNTSYLDLTIREKNFIFHNTSLKNTTMLLQLFKGRWTSIFQCM